MDLQLARKKFQTGYDYISQCHTGNYQESLWQLVQSQILEAEKQGYDKAIREVKSTCNNYMVSHYGNKEWKHKQQAREELVSEINKLSYK